MNLNKMFACREIRKSYLRGYLDPDPLPNQTNPLDPPPLIKLGQCHSPYLFVHCYTSLCGTIYAFVLYPHETWECCNSVATPGHSLPFVVSFWKIYTVSRQSNHSQVQLHRNLPWDFVLFGVVSFPRKFIQKTKVGFSLSYRNAV